MTGYSSNLEVRTYAPGDVVFRQWDLTRRMYVIRAGSVQIIRTVNDRSYVVSVLGPGEFFGELSIIADQPRSATAVVREQAELLIVEPPAFVKFLEDDPGFSARIIKGLAERLNRANEQAESVMRWPDMCRLVETLCELVEQQADDGLGERGAAYVPVTLDALATRARVGRASAVQAIEELMRAGLVTSASAVGIYSPGYLVSEVDRLFDYLDQRRYQWDRSLPAAHPQAA